MGARTTADPKSFLVRAVLVLGVPWGLENRGVESPQQNGGLTMKIDSPTAVAAQDHAADLDRLGDEIAELSAHLDAAMAHLLALIREFDARAG